MKTSHVAMAAVSLAAATMSWRSQPSPAASANQKSVADTIISLERGALDRWGRGDPQGYIDIYGPEITYFDPFTAKRIDGLADMKAMLAPFTGKIKVSSYQMLNPRVQLAGDVGILSFNLESHAQNPDGSPRTVHWNSTEVYRRVAGKWKIVHTHWSFTRPELKQPGTP